MSWELAAASTAGDATSGRAVVVVAAVFDFL